jgi:hypothetical protein
MMRQFDDPDQAVSWAAVLIFFGALFPVINLLTLLFRDPLSLTRIGNLIFFGAIVAQVVGAAFLLKQRRWAWPVTVAGVAVGTVYDLLLLPSQGIFGLIGLAIEAFVLYLLFRPAVRERFGVGQR